MLNSIKYLLVGMQIQYKVKKLCIHRLLSNYFIWIANALSHGIKWNVPLFNLSK